MRRWLCTGVALIASLLTGALRAETSPPFNPVDYYQEAMQALSEGRIDDARSALAILIANEPDSPGGWLDLATLRCSVGDAAEAERLFQEIELRFAPPPAIVEIIDQQRASGCTGPRLQARAQSSVVLGRGYDSNANQGVSNPNFSIGSGSNRVDLVVLPAYLPIGDHYWALSANSAVDLPYWEDTTGLLQIQTRNYDVLSQVDSASLLAGVEHAWRSGGWIVRGGVSGSITTLGGNDYLNLGQVQVQAQPPLNLPAGWHYLLATGWSSLSYPSYPEYDGNIFEARNSLRFFTEDGVWQANAGLLFDKQVHQRPGGDRQGYFASLDRRFRLPRGVIAELGWQYQKWQSSEPYSPGLIDVCRKQETQVLRASMTLPLTSNQSILAEYQYTNNRENISLFEYKGQVLQINWQYRWEK